MMFDLCPGQRECSYFQEADEYGMSGSRLRLGRSCLGQTGFSSQSSQCCLRLLSLSVLALFFLSWLSSALSSFFFSPLHLPQLGIWPLGPILNCQGVAALVLEEALGLAEESCVGLAYA